MKHTQKKKNLALSLTPRTLPFPPAVVPCVVEVTRARGCDWNLTSRPGKTIHDQYILQEKGEEEMQRQTAGFFFWLVFLAFLGGKQDAIDRFYTRFTESQTMHPFFNCIFQFITVKLGFLIMRKPGFWNWIKKQIIIDWVSWELLRIWCHILMVRHVGYYNT